jgi:hypothetical protein
MWCDNHHGVEIVQKERFHRSVHDLTNEYAGQNALFEKGDRPFLNNTSLKNGFPLSRE